MNNQEVTDLLISWISLSAAFAFVFSDGGLNIAAFSNFLPIAALAVGTGFLLHELAHKYVAIYFGAKAEFRAWNMGLIIALAFAFFFRFIFAAPGAVYIYGKHVTLRENGIISLAGPLMNVIIGVIGIFMTAAFSTSYIGEVSFQVARINFFLAMFNLLPIFILDGAKVFAWNKLVWALFFVPLVIFLFL